MADVGYYLAEETFTVEVCAVGEKQISVDPISLKEPRVGVPLPPAAKSRFLSFSLPNSASSSPTSKQKKKKCKSNQGRTVSPLARQHSVALSNLERLRESHIRRSKSCGEGRACQPSVDFDLWSTANSVDKLQEYRHPLTADQSCKSADEDGDQEEAKVFHKIKLGGSQVDSSSYEDKFKCGALCLFLPSFGGKAKAVRARNKSDDQMESKNGKLMERHHADIVVSQRVSLEKFECGSWRSSAVISYEDQYGDSSTSSNLFFDLPVEMIRCSTVNDTESPVTAAFVFDNKDHHQQYRKGVLKNSSSTATATNTHASQESSNSSRHVRFSTSSPTLCPASPTSSSCITPRLLKARDDFNAFLEAQSA